MTLLNKRKLVLLVVFSAISFFCSAQSQNDSTKTNTTKNSKEYKVKKFIKIAERKLNKGEIYEASDLYEEIMTHAPENAAVAYKLAHSYLLARDYKNAEKWFTKTTELDAQNIPLAAYYQALMMKFNRKYPEAKSKFLSFSKSYNGEEALKFKKWAKVDAQGCDLALELIKDSASVTVKQLSPAINTAYTEVSPVLWDDSTLLFASLPTDSILIIGNDTIRNDYFIKLFQSHFNDTTYKQAKLFDLFNEMGYHITNGAFSPNRDRFYFTKCTEGRMSQIRCSIFMSELKDGKWRYPEALGFNINTLEATNTHPSVANYKLGTEILYFTSDRSGGKGGLDIWYSIISKSGKHLNPKNLGSKINTDRDEATPFYDVEDATLYFSSKGHPNLGGYDVFKAEGSGSHWQEPINLGYPINFSTDDMYFKLNNDKATGYFVSNRPGITSIRSETCCDDIFRYKYPKVIRIGVKGFVYDEEDVAKIQITNARVELSFRGEKDIKEDIDIRAMNTKWNTPYMFNLSTEKEYRVSASADGYLTGYINFDSKGITNSDTFQINIYLKKLVPEKVYRLTNIYYDYNKIDLRESAQVTLDTLYNLLFDNPAIIIELGSHSDSRGEQNYNLQLSQQRADACVQYLIDKGISEYRLVATGYGENKMIEDCSQNKNCPNDNKTDCPCHQRNRRTEFKIIGKLDADLIYEDARFDE